MDAEERKFFSEKLDKLDSKVEGAREEIRVVQTNLGDRLRAHKDELVGRIESVRGEMREQAKESGARWAAVDKEFSVHKEALCPNLKAHEEKHHNIAKAITILVGLMTIASIGAAALLWVIGKVH